MSGASDQKDRAEAKAANVKSREEGRITTHSAGGKDIVKRSKDTPDRYTCLVDFPKWGYRAGETEHLSEPFDEQFACSLKEMAESLPPV